MFRFSRAYQHTAEFEARQMGFDFALVARTVLEIARAAKARLVAWWKGERKGLYPAPSRQKFHQLVLDLDSIAQIPMIFDQGV